MNVKTLELREKNKFIKSDDVGDNIRFTLNEEGELTILSSSLQAVNRILSLDKNQIKILIKFLSKKEAKKK